MSTHTARDRAVRRARRSAIRSQDAHESRHLSQPAPSNDDVIDLTGEPSSPLRGDRFQGEAREQENPRHDNLSDNRTKRDHHGEAQARPPQRQEPQATPDAKSEFEYGDARAEGDDGADGQTIDEDDTCPICQLLLHDPVRTTCNHTLCSFCMATWASVSLAAPMAIVDVDEVPVDFDAVQDLEARCPMCRTLTAARPDTQRREALREKYPRAYAMRSAEVAAEQSLAGGTGGGAGVQTITVYIGNRHTLVAPSPSGLQENQHEWEFFVRPSRTDIIEEVHMHLHPTFRPSRVVRQRAPYVITRLGWGVFQVTADVVLKAGYEWVSDDARDTVDGARRGVLPLEWMLDFEGFGGKGSMARCRLKVRREGVQASGGAEDEDAEMARDARETRRMVRQYERDGRYEPSATRRRRQ
ncbi:uncharacterized protein B0I36DRAFT_327166 [Microdochium trichocladiopsis]|uniref:RING-type domain-containing protein n=1 Tax=Microdochium trichocladiopsis TaxID=1682393 RepID=A0A9P9BRP1_9PEZI|nr:uncharacterized protein B0I36DRAFT_327166 [Microdochium trichocladiopsis]KAH7027475.1 hypothetical protein B0I36DRAFT_327166 [Microdochium trichocladiopsis]